MSFFIHQHIKFHYAEEGSGYPVIFLHGLGGDLQQPYDLLKSIHNIRLISFDFRGHGKSRINADFSAINMQTFSQDVFALTEHLKIDRFVLGGISLGAAISMKFCLNYPDLATKLILIRPAWINLPDPPNLEPIKLTGSFIEQFGKEEGLKRYKETAIYQEIAEQSPGCAQSLEGQFNREQAAETFPLLQYLAEDAPFKHWAEIEKIQTPVLILANDQDPLHPLLFAEMIAQHMSKSTFKKVTSKYSNPDKHQLELRALVRTFLKAEYGKP